MYVSQWNCWDKKWNEFEWQTLFLPAVHLCFIVQFSNEFCQKSNVIVWTYAIFSDGERHGTSSSSSSSLSSHSSPSSWPDILNEDDVNISGTGRIDGLRLPEEKNRKKRGETAKIIVIARVKS